MRRQLDNIAWMTHAADLIMFIKKCDNWVDEYWIEERGNTEKSICHAVSVNWLKKWVLWEIDNQSESNTTADWECITL